MGIDRLRDLVLERIDPAHDPHDRHEYHEHGDGPKRGHGLRDVFLGHALGNPTVAMGPDKSFRIRRSQQDSRLSPPFDTAKSCARHLTFNGELPLW